MYHDTSLSRDAVYDLKRRKFLERQGTLAASVALSGMSRDQKDSRLSMSLPPFLDHSTSETLKVIVSESPVVEQASSWPGAHTESGLVETRPNEQLSSLLTYAPSAELTLPAILETAPILEQMPVVSNTTPASQLSERKSPVPQSLPVSQSLPVGMHDSVVSRNESSTATRISDSKAYSFGADSDQLQSRRAEMKKAYEAALAAQVREAQAKKDAFAESRRKRGFDAPRDQSLAFPFFSSSGSRPVSSGLTLRGSESLARRVPDQGRAVDSKGLEPKGLYVSTESPTSDVYEKGVSKFMDRLEVSTVDWGVPNLAREASSLAKEVSHVAKEVPALPREALNRANGAPSERPDASSHRPDALSGVAFPFSIADERSSVQEGPSIYELAPPVSDAAQKKLALKKALEEQMLEKAQRIQTEKLKAKELEMREDAQYRAWLTSPSNRPRSVAANVRNKNRNGSISLYPGDAAGLPGLLAKPNGGVEANNPGNDKSGASRPMPGQASISGLPSIPETEPVSSEPHDRAVQFQSEPGSERVSGGFMQYSLGQPSGGYSSSQYPPGPGDCVSASAALSAVVSQNEKFYEYQNTLLSEIKKEIEFYRSDKTSVVNLLSSMVDKLMQKQTQDEPKSKSEAVLPKPEPVSQPETIVSIPEGRSNKQRPLPQPNPVQSAYFANTAFDGSFTGRSSFSEQSLPNTSKYLDLGLATSRPRTNESLIGESRFIEVPPTPTSTAQDASDHRSVAPKNDVGLELYQNEARPVLSGSEHKDENMADFVVEDNVEKTETQQGRELVEDSQSEGVIATVTQDPAAPLLESRSSVDLSQHKNDEVILPETVYPDLRSNNLSDSSSDSSLSSKPVESQGTTGSTQKKMEGSEFEQLTGGSRSAFSSSDLNPSGLTKDSQVMDSQTPLVRSLTEKRVPETVIVRSQMLIESSVAETPRSESSAQLSEFSLPSDAYAYRFAQANARAGTRSDAGSDSEAFVPNVQTTRTLERLLFALRKERFVLDPFENYEDIFPDLKAVSKNDQREENDRSNVGAVEDPSLSLGTDFAKETPVMETTTVDTAVEPTSQAESNGGVSTLLSSEVKQDERSEIEAISKGLETAMTTLCQLLHVTESDLRADHEGNIKAAEAPVDSFGVSSMEQQVRSPQLVRAAASIESDPTDFPSDMASANAMTGSPLKIAVIVSPEPESVFTVQPVTFDSTEGVAPSETSVQDLSQIQFPPQGFNHKNVVSISPSAPLSPVVSKTRQHEPSQHAAPSLVKPGFDRSDSEIANCSPEELVLLADKLSDANRNVVEDYQKVALQVRSMDFERKLMNDITRLGNLVGTDKSVAENPGSPKGGDNSKTQENVSSLMNVDEEYTGFEGKGQRGVSLAPARPTSAYGRPQSVTLDAIRLKIRLMEEFGVLG